ncbi:MULTISPECIES: hypothetical protein [Pontibacter]|uniref:Uncharacterized protein n=1 Tax=Pontibacter qinzhouensis TaxID=2603253 RepID=A0A5C8K8P1_9BACT|nr:MULTISPECIES: hypothetical protein [Pontibacter]QCR25266.1 hypothetical protein C1N53_22360 [Pontibacter sp. SGAir0037]TXK50046.1 hypothetical protein FVR03_05435 [Pontibacter qinzhouensis]
MAEIPESPPLGFLPFAKLEKDYRPLEQKVRKAAVIREVFVDMVEVAKFAREVIKLNVKRQWQVLEPQLSL